MNLNPWREGEYWCYGEAVKLAEGQLAAYYFIEHDLPTGERRCVYERRRFGLEIYPTADLARPNAVSAGQYWVRSQAA
jgi:hypothetical protein